MSNRTKVYRVEILRDCEASLTGGVTGSFRRFNKGWSGPVPELCFKSLMAQDGAARDITSGGEVSAPASDGAEEVRDPPKVEPVAGRRTDSRPLPGKAGI